MSYFKIKKDIFALILFLLVSISINWNWITGTVTNTSIGIEEGYLDLATIKSLSHSEDLLWYDLRTYGQPSEVTPYGRICVNIIPILLMYIVNNETVAFVLSWVILLFLSMFFMYLILSKILNINTHISIAFSVLYVLSHPVSISAMVHGHMRYLMIIFLSSFYLFTLFILLSCKKSYFKLFLSFNLFIESLLFIWTHAVIFGTMILLFIPILIIIKENLFEKQFFKYVLYVSIPTLLVGIIWSYIFVNCYSIFYNLPLFSKNSYCYTEMSNLISMLFLNWNIPNRDPLVWQSLSDITLNLIHSFPFFASLLFLVYNRKKWLAWFIVFLIMLFSCGVYGPFFAVYNLFKLPFRAPGRIFLSAAYPFLIILGAIGADIFIQNLKQKLKLNYKINNYICAFLIVFLIFSTYHTSIVAEYTYNLNPSLDDAYSKIPKYSRVLMLPVWGNVGSGISLSYNGTYKYQPYPTVGYSVMHLHEYLSAKDNLKNAFSPPSPWEVPFLTLWTFSDFLWEKIIKWKDFDGFYQHLRLFPNLQYIIVYKHILPDDIVKGLQNDKYVEKYYENDDLLILKVKNQTNNEIVVSNKSFILYTSEWRYGHSALLTLASIFNITHPIIFEGITPWYFLKPSEIGDKNTTFIVINSNNAYVLEDIVLDSLYFNKILQKEGMTIDLNEIRRTNYWQPAYNKSAMVIENNKLINKTIYIQNSDKYILLLRVDEKGRWRPKFKVYIDNKNIVFIHNKNIVNFELNKTIFGWRWVKSSPIDLSKGNHKFEIKSKGPLVGINTIILLKKEEFRKLIKHEKYLLLDNLRNKKIINGYKFKYTSGFENILYKNTIWGKHVKPFVFNGKLKTTLNVIGKPRFVIVFGELKELKIENATLYHIEKENVKNNTLHIFKIIGNFTEFENTINIEVNGKNLDAVWITNFDPLELQDIKTYYITTPKGYNCNYKFVTPINKGWILLIKSYWQGFKCISKGKRKISQVHSYISNIMLNGLYFNSKHIEIKL